MVNHPEHYGGKENIYEVVKVCEAWGLDKDAYIFNVVKYVARAGKKDTDKERHQEETKRDENRGEEQQRREENAGEDDRKPSRGHRDQRRRDEGGKEEEADDES